MINCNSKTRINIFRYCDIYITVKLSNVCWLVLSIIYAKNLTSTNPLTITLQREKKSDDKVANTRPRYGHDLHFGVKKLVWRGTSWHSISVSTKCCNSTCSGIAVRRVKLYSTINGV